MDNLQAEDMENVDGDEVLRKLAQKAEIHPLMPNKYNPVKRAELREFEKELLKGTKIEDIER